MEREMTYFCFLIIEVCQWRFVMAREMTYFCLLIIEVCYGTRDDLFLFSDN